MLLYSWPAMKFSVLVDSAVFCNSRCSAQLVYTTRPRSFQKGNVNGMGGMGTAQPGAQGTEQERPPRLEQSSMME